MIFFRSMYTAIEQCFEDENSLSKNSKGFQICDSHQCYLSYYPAINRVIQSFYREISLLLLEQNFSHFIITLNSRTNKLKISLKSHTDI